MHDTVCYQRAYRIECLALMPKRHPLARTPGLRLTDLVEHSLVVGHPMTYGSKSAERSASSGGIVGSTAHCRRDRQ